jgi:hypothetical protein
VSRLVPGAIYSLAVREPAENCCAQRTEQTRSRGYKSAINVTTKEQHKVTQGHGNTYALFFTSCTQRDLPSARFATLERKNRSGECDLVPHRTRPQSAALVSCHDAPHPLRCDKPRLVSGWPLGGSGRLRDPRHLEALARPGLSFIRCVIGGRRTKPQKMRWLVGHQRRLGFGADDKPPTRRLHQAGRGAFAIRAFA